MEGIKYELTKKRRAELFKCHMEIFDVLERYNVKGEEYAWIIFELKKVVEVQLGEKLDDFFKRN